MPIAGLLPFRGSVGLVAAAHQVAGRDEVVDATGAVAEEAHGDLRPGGRLELAWRENVAMRNSRATRAAGR
jgi:hypothetical protein